MLLLMAPWVQIRRMPDSVAMATGRPLGFKMTGRLNAYPAHNVFCWILFTNSVTLTLNRELDLLNEPKKIRMYQKLPEIRLREKTMYIAKSSKMTSFTVTKLARFLWRHESNKMTSPYKMLVTLRSRISGICRHILLILGSLKRFLTLFYDH